MMGFSDRVCSERKEGSFVPEESELGTLNEVVFVAEHVQNAEEMSSPIYECVDVSVI